MNKRILAWLLCLAMLGSFALPAMADPAGETQSTQPTAVTQATEATQPEETVGTTAPATVAPTETTQPTEAAQPTETTQPAETTQPTESGPATPTTGKDSRESGESGGNLPKVGDKLWIKPGSLVYKSTQGEEGYAVSLPYKIEIVAIDLDANGNHAWYRYKYADFSALVGGLFLKDYAYVKAADTSLEEPDASQPDPTQPGETEPEETNPQKPDNTCTCENPPQSLASHADACPRKQYILELVKDKTAQELYDAWDSYDEETQQDILNILEVYTATTYTELVALLGNADSGEEDEEPVYVQFTGTASNGVAARICAMEGAFPEGTSVTVTPVTVSASQVQGIVGEQIRGIVAVDIDFGGQQPDGRVGVSMQIPAGKIPSGANKVYVVHFGSNGAEVVTSQYMRTTQGGRTIVFGTESFSSYAAVFVNSQYNAQKMRDVLAGDGRYSIHTFPVDLFDYDPVPVNGALKAAANGGNAFEFVGYPGTGSSNGGINDSDQMAKQGIVQDKLQNGLPVFNHVSNGAGAETGKILFGDSISAAGKTIYNDIPFEFVYDNQTGYYEYKSSANHAQYNATTGRIELYADTLSTKNYYVATLDLTTAYGEYGYQNISTTNGVFKATAVGGVDRFDPYISFTVPGSPGKTGLDAGTIKQIYVKAKVPASVGANKFQLFFDDGSDYNENNSFLVDYTPNGEWIQFVVDTSTCPYWTSGKTISSLRVDLFDSNRGSGIDKNQSYAVEIQEIRLIGYYDDTTTRGGFYPFSEIQDSYPGNNTRFDLSTWKALMQNDNTAVARASRSIFNPDGDADALAKELCYGVVMEFDFYIPVGGQVDGKDLEYIFNGDDDLWVFVDDQLVLDIGGGHGAITGKVNFTKGTSWVEKAVKVTGFNTATGGVGDATAVSGTLASTLYSPGKHTMKLFYMERCGSVSNCYMKFNLPQTPQGSVEVSKNVTVNGSDQDVLASEKFEFAITVKNQGAGEYQNETAWANQSFVLMHADNTSENAKTDAQGKFQLADGERAFFDIPENYLVKVTETKKEITNYQWVSTKVNNTDAFSVEQTTVKNQKLSYAFDNTYRALYGNLTITKKGLSGGETQNTMFTVKGQGIELRVTICGNSSITIEHLPVGAYTVTEETDWTWRYDVVGEKTQTATVPGDDTARVTFTNQRAREYWLSGDSYCRNWWGGTNGSVLRDPNKG